MAERKLISDGQEKFFAKQREFLKVKSQKELEMRKAEEHEARKRGEPSLGERYIKDGPMIATALREYRERSEAKTQNRNANIESARQHEANKSRGTSSSSVRRVIP